MAIEEQFYIVFPIVCTLIWRFSRSRTIIAAAVVLITAGSLIACLLVRNEDFNFYFPLTRFWELGVGICLAFVESYGIFQARHMAKGVRNFLSCAGLAAILAPMALWSTGMTHPGWITLFPVLGAVSLIAANPDACLNHTLLSWRPMTYVGLVSYSLYLWHWPLLAFLFLCMPDASPGWHAAALLLSFALASIVYFGVENPVRRSRAIGGISTTALLLFGLVMAFAFGQILRSQHGFPNRNVSSVQEVSCVRAVGEWESYEAAPKIEYFGIEMSAPDNNTFPSIVFAGDSHVTQYYLRAKRLSDEFKTNVGFVGKTLNFQQNGTARR